MGLRLRWIVQLYLRRLLSGNRCFVCFTPLPPVLCTCENPVAHNLFHGLHALSLLFFICCVRTSTLSYVRVLHIRYEYQRPTVFCKTLHPDTACSIGS